MATEQIQAEFSPADPTARTVDVPLVAAGGRIVLQAFTTPGSQYIGTVIKAMPNVGDYPDYMFWSLHTVEQSKGLENYIRYSVLRALRRDGVPEGKAMPCRLDLNDHNFIVVCASQDELRNFANGIASMRDVANQRFR